MEEMHGSMLSHCIKNEGMLLLIKSTLSSLSQQKHYVTASGNNDLKGQYMEKVQETWWKFMEADTRL
ncbi:hypothetical protein DEO72_LG3g1765 [Vigna unguiculata]|uniref:Uncharacterized protein n=1 Tax=Vigna unguiculata TaxID=3917 RepID=A0A4D6LF45_VIGUN|nr:hypothetical protein DEO72_LG3g1765 [Vigna unguiculata]